jgi:hypothetical protein
LPYDRSSDRLSYLTGRLEDGARLHYASMLEVASSFSSETPKRMSLLTQTILKGLDYNYIRNQRRSNYQLLQDLLPSDNPFTKNMPIAPFAYPYYHADGIALRRYLADRNIFVQTNWSYLIKMLPEGSNEYDWSANILPLPVDQRYGADEMRTIVDAIRSY